MEEKTASMQPEVLLSPCSGASNLGQISNEVALKMRDAGKGKMSCTAGIGGHVKPLVDAARTAKNVLAIDGCSTGCVMKCFVAERIRPTAYLVLSDYMGIEKNSKRPSEDDVRKALEITISKL